MLRLLFLLLLLGVSPTAQSQQRPAPAAGSAEPVKIQVALLLDTSNSMDGLIDQAKSQLWQMVNKLADAKNQYHDVVLEIALYEYGNDGLAEKTGYVRRVQAMGTDLDGLSEQLFALSTNGGSEYCGWAIQTSLDSLGWTNKAEDLRLVIVAGNEPFDQGPIDFRKSCANAAGKDVIVNTIFCGDEKEGRRTHWFDCTEITHGKYLNINTNERVAHIPTPYDSTLLRLNEELNKTYLGYGVRGEERKERQVKQDQNAASYGAANLAQRAAAKSKKSYSNSDWDVVDAYVADSTFVDKAKVEDLPKEWQGKSKDQIKVEIKALQARRAALRKELAALEIKMQAYVTEERKKRAQTQTLDNVLIETIATQARNRGFTF